ncbi:hypothetical protein LUZ60_000020 [Juncus effusus]|nr:hypothetical protein LUZ60_000020 [Juncus effusus]
MDIRYKKAMPAFDETARARFLWGQSFSSTSSDDSSDELADLVDSFYDSEGEEEIEEEEGKIKRDEMNGGDLMEVLDDVLEEIDDDAAVSCIQVEVEKALRVIGSNFDNGLMKQRVVRWLRARGIDAGLCVSSWEPMNGLLAGSHEFIDVVTDDKTRYIIEINLAFYFEIAKPNKEYTRLLQRIPRIFIARPEQMKSVVRLISNASVKSIRSAGMHVAPWRKREYVFAKWFSPFERSDGSDNFVIMEKEDQNVYIY